MLTSLLARCCDQVPYYIICANVFRQGYKIRKIRHLRGAKAHCISKKIRAIGAIRER